MLRTPDAFDISLVIRRDVTKPSTHVDLKLYHSDTVDPTDSIFHKTMDAVSKNVGVIRRTLKTSLEPPSTVTSPRVVTEPTKFGNDATPPRPLFPGVNSPRVLTTEPSVPAELLPEAGFLWAYTTT